MASSEHHTPGEPPPIRDEAADTPMWVPAAGLTMLILCAVFLAWQSASEREDAHHEDHLAALEDAEVGDADDGAEADEDAADEDAE